MDKLREYLSSHIIKETEFIRNELIKESKRRFEMVDLLNNKNGFFGKGTIENGGRLQIFNMKTIKGKPIFEISFETNEYLIKHKIPMIEFFKTETPTQS